MSETVLLSLFGLAAMGIGCGFGFTWKVRSSLPCDDHGQRIAKLETSIGEVLPLLKEIAENVRPKSVEN